MYVTDIYCAEKAITTHLVNYREPFPAWPSCALCAGVHRCKTYEQHHHLVIINFNLICLTPAHQFLPQNRTSFKQLWRKCHWGNIWFGRNVLLAALPATWMKTVQALYHKSLSNLIHRSTHWLTKANHFTEWFHLWQLYTFPLLLGKTRRQQN